jgi:hypothetical protein
MTKHLYVVLVAFAILGTLAGRQAQAQVTCGGGIHVASSLVVCPSGSGSATPTATPTAGVGDPDIITIPNSTFNNRIPENPNIATNSNAIISYMANGITAQTFDVGCCAGMYYQFGAQGTPPPQYATRAAVYNGITTDTNYTITDEGNYGLPIVTGSIHIPSGALPEGGKFGCGGEQHAEFVDATQPTVFYDAIGWSSLGASAQVSGCPTPVAGTIIVQNMVKYTTATTNGWGCIPSLTTCVGGAVNSTGRVLSQGLVTPYELNRGYIGHALAVTIACSSGFTDAPALGADDPCSTTTNAIGGGQKMIIPACVTYPFCSVTASLMTIATWPVPSYTMTVLNAMATFGMYETDTLGGSTGGWYIETLDPASYGSAHPITNYWPAFNTQFSPANYPSGINSYGYDFDFRGVPNNPNAPTSSSGLYSWLAVCSRYGC